MIAASAARAAWSKGFWDKEHVVRKSGTPADEWREAMAELTDSANAEAYD